MIPILYEASETQFTSEGICRLVDCLSCEVEEVQNGIYECEFMYPTTGRHYEEIIEGRIIAARHDETGDVQPFDIYAHTVPNMDGVVTFYAHHISYRQSNIIVTPYTASSCAQAMMLIPDYSANTNPFTYWTDKTVASSFSLAKPISAKALLGGTAGSILDVFGRGEYEWDKFTVKFHLNRGQDNGVEIRYAKNLVKLRQDVSTLETYNAVAPYWTDMNGGNLVMLNDVIVSTPEARQRTDEHGNTYMEELKPIAVDLSMEFNEKPTQAQLEARALALFTQAQPWVPDQSFEIDFAALWQTDEYAAIAPLERVSMGDTVHVIYPESGINAKVKVVRTVYNALLERYDEIELGKVKSSFAQVVQRQAEKDILGVVPIASTVAAAMEEAASKITGVNGGHMLQLYDASGDPYGVAFMDQKDVSQAQTILMINKEGIAGTTHGISGPFGVAITSDGHIVADYITSGTLQGVEVIADTGRIGGWMLGTDGIYKDYQGTDEDGNPVTVRVKLSWATYDGQYVLSAGYQDGSTLHPKFAITAGGEGYFRQIRTQKFVGGFSVDGTIIVGDSSHAHGLAAYGNVSGANGNFSGNVSGVNGIFSGNVSGLNGTFSGFVSADQVHNHNTLWLYWGDTQTGRIAATAGNYMYFGGTDSDRWVILASESGHWGFSPWSDTYLDLGHSGHRWDNIYAQNGAIQTSDRRQKKYIKPLKKKILDFVRGLKPVSFLMKNGKRTHYGFIAQDVESLIEEQGLDFAGFIKQEQENGDTFYGLRYEEFIAPLTKMVQDLDERVAALERGRNE